MSFSMSKINKYVKDNKVKNNTHPLFAYISSLSYVSADVRKILNTYLKYRLTTLPARGLTVDKLNTMIVELLENCCGKNITEITPDDTEANYGEILYQLKYAIDKKFRYKIYHNENKLTVEDLEFQEHKFKTIKSGTQKELDDFFEGVVIYD